jgi:protein-tyrosine-phosphatase
VGEDVYVDANEAEIITVEQANTGTGMLDWDGGYDTDIAKHLSECDERELKLIAEHDEDLIEEWCEMMDVVVDWKRFNGDYMGLIEDIHNSSKIDVEYYYREVEPDVERLGKK